MNERIIDEIFRTNDKMNERKGKKEKRIRGWMKEKWINEKNLWINK